MKNVFRAFLVMALAGSALGLQAQITAPPQRHKIALFAPLYLDSVFSNNTYRYGNTFPRFVNPGLEFYQGAQKALDSLKKAGAPLDVFIFDSRSAQSPLQQRMNGIEMLGTEMMIGHSTVADVRVL